MPSFTQTITNGNYDSFEIEGSAAELTRNPMPLTAGTRRSLFYFTNVTIPKNSTISAATMTVYVIDTNNDDPNLTIDCENAANASAPTTGTNDIKNRTVTGNAATWNASGVGAGTKTTPDFASAVQTVVNGASWASGNSLSVIFKGAGATSFQINGAEQGTGFQAAISVTYTPPGPAIPVVSQQFRRRRL